MTGRCPRSSRWLIAVQAILVMAFVSPACNASDRESWQPPGKIMDAVGVEPGMRIGEAGAGRGYFTFPMARRVGEEGVVYANDISTSALSVIKERAGAEQLDNIVTVVGEVEDPLFPEHDLDMIVMVYVLHFLDRPVEFMSNVAKYLGPDGQLVIIERDTHHERAHPPSYMTRREVLETIGKTSFQLERTETFLPRDTIYVFKLKKP